MNTHLYLYSVAGSLKAGPISVFTATMLITNRGCSGTVWMERWKEGRKEESKGEGRRKEGRDCTTLINIHYLV